MKKRVMIILSLWTLFVLSSAAVSATKTTVFFFHGAGCPHCAQMSEFLAQEQQNYPDLEVRSFEVWYDEENHALFEEMSSKYNTPIQGVPTLFINDTVLVGFGAGTAPQLDNIISACIDAGCDSPEKTISPEFSDTAIRYTPLPVEPIKSSNKGIFLAAFVLLLIIAVIWIAVYLSSQKRRKRK
ncbi:MAG: hypothetical protein KJ574_00045 [Nanoarchaeota archaeon]|nr:hypothetical protein [Nanoarchaeota archaeon]